jgi:CHAD domain-containing protein
MSAAQTLSFMAWQRLNAVMQSWAGEYIALGRRIRSDDNRELVHDFRVAARHLLAIEPLLRPLAKTGYWRRRMRRWLKDLNAVRDLQVMQQRLAGEVALQRCCEKEIQRAMRRWQRHRPRVVRKTFRKKLQRSLSRAAKNFDADPAGGQQQLLKQWRQTVAAVRLALAQLDPGQPATLHRLRVRYKALRYWIELLQAIELIAATDKKALKYWQDLLGEIHDLEVVLAWIEGQQQGAALAAALTEQWQHRRDDFLRQQDSFADFVTLLDAAVNAALAGPLRPEG